MPNSTAVFMEETAREIADFRPVEGQRFSEAQMAWALDLIRNAEGLPRHRHEFKMREAITTSDFPLLFGAVIERELLARYRNATVNQAPWIKQSTVPNFNVHTRDRLDGLTGILPLVGEKGEYLVSTKPTQNRTSIQVVKRGSQFDISWEALINDGLGAFSDVAQRYADAVVNTEAWLQTSLYAAAAGPNALLYGAPITMPDGSTCTNVGVLGATLPNLEATLMLMAGQTDPLGNPLGIRGVHIVCPPALEITFRSILTSAQKMWIDIVGGAGAALPYPTSNVLPQMGLQLHVDPWLPIIDVSGNRNGTWYVFADTTQGWAAEYARLRGHEAPEICMKASDKVTTGGGLISPFDGDFATDNVLYRVRMVGGGTQLDPRMTYAQVHT